MTTRAVTGVPATGPGSVTIPALTGVLAGDLLHLRVMSKHSTAATVPTTPTGWTQLGTGLGGTGSFSEGTGPVRVTVFVRTAAADDDGPATTVSMPGGNVMLGVQQAYRKDTAGTTVKAQWVGFGGDTTNGTEYSAVSDGGVVFQSGDILVTDSAFSAAITASNSVHIVPGSSNNTGSFANGVNSTTGNDLTLRSHNYKIGTGPSSGGAPSVSWTLSAASHGATAFTRVYEAPLTATNVSSTEAATETAAVTLAARDARSDSGAESASSVVASTAAPDGEDGATGVSVQGTGAAFGATDVTSGTGVASVGSSTDVVDAAGSADAVVISRAGAQTRADTATTLANPVTTGDVEPSSDISVSTGTAATAVRTERIDTGSATDMRLQGVHVPPSDSATTSEAATTTAVGAVTGEDTATAGATSAVAVQNTMPRVDAATATDTGQVIYGSQLDRVDRGTSTGNVQALAAHAVIDYATSTEVAGTLRTLTADDLATADTAAAFDSALSTTDAVAVLETEIVERLVNFGFVDDDDTASLAQVAALAASHSRDETGTSRSVTRFRIAHRPVDRGNFQETAAIRRVAQVTGVVGAGIRITAVSGSGQGTAHATQGGAAATYPVVGYPVL